MVRSDKIDDQFCAEHQTLNLEEMLRISLAMSALERRTDIPFRMSHFRF
jgi:hypothetical protein